MTSSVNEVDTSEIELIANPLLLMVDEMLGQNFWHLVESFILVTSP